MNNLIHWFGWGTPAYLTGIMLTYELFNENGHITIQNRNYMPGQETGYSNSINGWTYKY